jgi:TonB family protein
MADIAEVAQELAAEQAAAGAPKPAEEPTPAAEPAAEGGAELIGALDADQRIRTAADRSRRTLWISATCVTLLYVLVIAAQVMNLGGLSSIEHELEQQQRERERRGQDGTSISVEIVPEPDPKAKTQKWQDGANGPPTPAPPQPQQQAAPERPPVEQPKEQPQEQPKEEPEKQPPEEKPEDKPEEKEAEKAHDGGQPSLPDLDTLLDAAATDLQEKVKQHYDRPRRAQQQSQQQQATISGGGMQVRGQGAGGKSDAFTKSVIDALMRTRPGPFALWGRVLVSFQITQQGDLLYVRVVKSSGNKAMDDAAVNAIHRAKFVKPPPDLPAEARTYIIDYVFG